MVRTKRIKHQKRKVYRRKTRGGQLPSPEHSPIHVSPPPPSPLFRRPSHSPPKSRPTTSIFTRRAKKPGNLRRTKSAKVESDLRVLAQQQERINDIFARFARDSHGFDNAALDEYLESDS